MKNTTIARKKTWLSAAGAAAALVAGGMLLAAPPTVARDQRRPPPATAAEPLLISSATSAIAQTAAIVEGTVSDVISEYTPETGPYTRIAFTDLVVHRGEFLDAELSIVQKGGERPNGSMLVISSTPQFELGARYIVFLRNTSWSLSPVVKGHAFRVASEDARELLVTQEGGVLSDYTESGPAATEPLFESTDLARRQSVRLAGRSAPKRALDRGALLKTVDALSSVLGAKIGGTFYNEPVKRSKGTAQVRHPASALPANALPDSDLTPDPTQPVKQ